jgi:hypothetical protein
VSFSSIQVIIIIIIISGATAQIWVSASSRIFLRPSWIRSESDKSLPFRTLSKSKNVKLFRYHHTGAKGQRSYSSYSLFTLVLVGQRHSPVAFSPGERPPVPVGQEAGWASRAGLDTGYRKNSLPLPKIEHRSSSL